jgi:hypothetical protein
MRRLAHRRCSAFVHYEVLIVLTVLAILLAILVPLFAHAFTQAMRHGAGLGTAILQASLLSIGLPLFVFAGMPLLIALPIAGVAKMTRRRADRYRDLLSDYWGGAAGWVFGLFLLAGACYALWDWVISPLLRLLH